MNNILQFTSCFADEEFRKYYDWPICLKYLDVIFTAVLVIAAAQAHHYHSSWCFDRCRASKSFIFIAFHLALQFVSACCGLKCIACMKFIWVYIYVQLLIMFIYWFSDTNVGFSISSASENWQKFVNGWKILWWMFSCDDTWTQLHERRSTLLSDKNIIF